MHEIVTSIIVGFIAGGITGGLLVNYFLHRIGAAANVNQVVDTALHAKIDTLNTNVVSGLNQLAQHVTQQVSAITPAAPSTA